MNYESLYLYVFRYIYDKYPRQILPPVNETAVGLSNSKIIEQFQSILDIFPINQYCLSSSISEMIPVISNTKSKNILPTDSNKVLMTAQLVTRAPANLWSEQVLRNRKNSIINDFEMKMLRSYANTRGLELDVITSQVLNSIDVTRIINVRMI